MVKEKVDPISQIHSLNAGKVLLNSRNTEIHVMSSPKIELYEIAHVDLTLLQKMYVIQGGSSGGKGSV